MVLVDPTTRVLTPAPVAIFTVVAAASSDTDRVPVPLMISIAALVPVRVMPPEPDVMATDVVPVALPKVLTLEPVVARVVAPAEVRVVVAWTDPGAINVLGIEKVMVDPEPIDVISFAVPSRLMLLAEGLIAPPEPPVRVFRTPLRGAISFQVALLAATLTRM